jgi:hypothetical protein
VTGVRDQAATTVALLALVAVAWWSPWSGAPHDDVRMVLTTPGVADNADLSAFEPTTPGGLAAALLTHVDDRDVIHVDGTAGDGALDAGVELDDPAVSTYFVHVWTPESLSQLPSHCQRQAAVCRTLDDGTVVSVRRGGPGSGGPHGPKVSGYAYRRDSTVLVMAYGPSAEGISVRAVAEILSDPRIGPETTRAMNDAGEALANFEEMRIVGGVSELKSTDPPGGEPRSSGS